MSGGGVLLSCGEAHNYTPEKRQEKTVDFSRRYLRIGWNDSAGGETLS